MIKCLTHSYFQKIIALLLSIYGSINVYKFCVLNNYDTSASQTEDNISSHMCFTMYKLPRAINFVSSVV